MGADQLGSVQSPNQGIHMMQELASHEVVCLIKDQQSDVACVQTPALDGAHSTQWSGDQHSCLPTTIYK